MLAQVAVWGAVALWGPFPGSVSSPGCEGALARLCPGSLCVPGDVLQIPGLPAPLTALRAPGAGCTSGTPSGILGLHCPHSAFSPSFALLNPKQYIES